ncbi:hypothetical protein DPMN_111249 [Dreissena polymorpha]|uniref:Uncharacterized protein n=1 Tax=Dreissena polymorpha TaxID=45954 RepID=A0A9D4KDH7_DREPO|nr:hypothetical protein DPMN_111249 [Dreissena polymorpha]
MSIFRNLNAKCDGQTDRRTDRQTLKISLEQNVLTKFHDKVLTRINSLPTGGHVFQQTGTIFEPIQDIIKTNILTKFLEYWTMNVTFRVKNAPSQFIKFHEGWTINITLRVLTRKCPPPPWTPCFSTNQNNLKFAQDIIEKNLLTKVHEDWTLNVALRVFTRKNAPPLSGHVFQPTESTFKLIQDTYRTINVASRVPTNHNVRQTKGDHKSST